MDKEKTRKRNSFFQNAINSFRSEAARRKTERGALISDIAVFLCAFFFSRRHLFFGCYPLGAALVAALPSRVWIALIGAVVGSLSMGRVGVIHAGVSLIIIFLRIIISSGSTGGKEEGVLFSEPLIMRLSAAAIGSFVGAGYEMLLSGFSFSSVLFGVFGVGLTLLFSFAYMGLFFAEITTSDFLYGERTLFRKRDSDDRMGILFFQGSLALIFFLFSFSLGEYVYFGISLSYVFTVALALFISKRFGAVRGAVIGFICSAGVSPLYSPAFALVGAVSSLLYQFGIGYALVGSGILFSVWGAYVGGVNGFLSLLPEYLISSVLIFSVLKRSPTEKEEGEAASLSKTSEEMVVASWLSERANEPSMGILEEALYSVSDKIKELFRDAEEGNFDTYREICEKNFEQRNIPPDREIINKIATKLYKKQKITPEDRENFISKYGEELLAGIYTSLASYERSLYEKRKAVNVSEEYFLISKMISEARLSKGRESAVNDSLTALAAEVFVKSGFPEGTVRVFGEDKIRILGAGQDPDGRLITSPDLKLALEGALGYRLGKYEYFRREDMALFKCSAVAAYTAAYATASRSASGSEVSGDSARFFGNDSLFFSVISDGMGSGREARSCADFVNSYLSELLLSDVSADTAIAALSRLIRQREGECTATLDLFRLDLIRAEALFIKSGAAPSYVKRGKSIFRIRSETAPIGLMKSLDAEKIRVEIKSGDVVIMLSDGVSSSIEDSSWLLSFLSKEEVLDPEEYAKEILRLAERKCSSRDDMTVSVIQILGA